jgi:hydroxymethylbilane synthase
VVEGDQLEIIAAVIALDGSRLISGRASASRADADGLGRRVATQLLADGAGDILADAQKARP